MASLVAKLRPDRTRTQRLAKGQSGELTPERCSPRHPGKQAIREVLELLYSNPDTGTPNDVPSLLLEGQSTPRRRVTSGGLSVLPWEMFLKDPDKLKDVLLMGANNHISYDPETVNALFRATFMDNPAFGDISTQGDAWVITVESIRELGKLRTLLTGRMSILGMSIARYNTRWSTANRVPCLLMIDPDDDSIRETFDSAFNEAEQSLSSGKNFCLQIDLNGSVEAWCRAVLGARCESLGAKLIVTSGEPYQPILSSDRVLCCVLCLPLWGVQSCIYQIQRKSTYDDYNISPNLDVRLHDGGWVRKERKPANETSDDSGCSSPKHNRRKANCKPKDEHAVPDNISEVTPSSDAQEYTRKTNSTHKSPRLRKRKDKRAPGLSRRNGEDNSGFELSESSNTSGNTPSPDYHDNIRQVEPQGQSSGESKNGRSRLSSRVVTSEMLLTTDPVELTKFSQLYERGHNDGPRQHNGHPYNGGEVISLGEDSTSSSGTPNTGSPSSRSTDKTIQGSENGLNTHVQRFKNQQFKDQRRFTRSESGSDLSRDTLDSDSSGLTSTSPCDSAASDGQVGYFKNGQKVKKDKYGRFFSKPKSILKEFRRTTDGALSKIMRNGMDEYARSEPMQQRPASAVPGNRRSVHFDDEAQTKGPSKTNKSWVTEDVKPLTEQARKVQPNDVVTKQPSSISLRSENGNEKKEQKNNESNGKQSQASKNPPVADGMLTNAWSFGTKMNRQSIVEKATVPKSPSTPKSFLRPKAKVVFSTDEEDSDVDWRSSTSRLIVVNGPGKSAIFDSTTELEKDTETDTEISHFRLEDVDDQEVNYLSDSHISVPTTRRVNKTPNNKSKKKRNSGNFKKQQCTSLPRRRLYNPKKQSLSMLSLDALDL